MVKEFFVLLLIGGITQSISNKSNTNRDNLISDAFENFGEVLTNNDSNDPDAFVPDIIEDLCEPGSECIPFYLCKDIDKTGPIEIRIDSDDENNSYLKKCTYLDRCCAIEKKSPEVVNITKPTSEGCGYRNINGVGFRIIGAQNNEAEYGEFPWMVAILLESEKYLCGGSLITPSVILTAAHYVNNKDPNILSVRAGEWDTQTKKEIFENQIRKVSEKVIHEDFYKGGLYNDIALLFVSKPFNLKNTVRTICLPPYGMTFDDKRCFATGWGQDTFGKKGKYQVILKKVELPIVSNQECQNIQRTTRLGTNFKLHQSFICAGGEIGKDTCKGDGGSPLVCPIPNKPNRYIQAGIVSWGLDCGSDIPGVYASVSHLRPWIDEVLDKKDMSNSYFIP